jgi:hypothetical protein
MKIFNIDLHISIVGDLRLIFADLGHELVDWSLSGHTHIFNRTQKQNGIVDQNNWYNLNKKMCDDFYNKYKDELNSYDAFLCTYPVSFSMLYEKFQKPIIIYTPIRYEAPFWQNASEWENFNSFLRKNIDCGLVIPIANSKYDKYYSEYFVEREFECIPSWCEYTNIKYFIDNKRPIATIAFSNINLSNGIINLPMPFIWNDLNKYKGIVNIPYNASVMKIFEQYTANIPMFFPTQNFLCKMRFEIEEYKKVTMNQLSFNQVFNLESKSCIKCNSKYDPNNFNDIEIFRHWIPLSDFYDDENMPYIIYFDSINNLYELSSTSNLEEISEKMKNFNVKRKDYIYKKWIKILDRIK